MKNSNIKKQMLIIFYFLMRSLCVIQLFYWINRKKKLVLTFHNIIPDELYDHSIHLGVSHKKSVFDAHLKLIQKRFVSHKRGEKICHCLITFDDGYKNQVEIASRLLDQYHLKGLFFISFQSMSTGQALIIDKILQWISYVPTGNYSILGTMMTVTNDNRASLFNHIYEKLICNHRFWNVIENELECSFPFDSLPVNKELARLRFEPVNANDVELLIKNGHFVGAHSWSHFPLKILSLEEQKKDFLISIQYAKKYCNSLTYSYPFGGMAEVSDQTAKLCEEAGFKTAYMNLSESPRWTNVNDQYQLPRLSLPNDDNRYLLEAKLSGFESFCKKILKTLFSKEFRK